MAKVKKKHSGKSGETKPAPRLPSWVPISVVGLTFALLTYRFFRLISEYAVNIFFSDQWDFNNAVLFERHSLWQIFAWQHGPCRLGLGTLLEFFVEPLFRWNSRTESFLVGGIITVAAACAVWLKWKLFGRLSILDAIIPFIFLDPRQYETLFVTADLAHGPLPLLLIVLYCLAWTCRDIRLRLALVLVINFVAIYTGFGLFLGAITPLLFAIDYWINHRELPNDKVYFASALLISLASLGSFFIGYTSQPAADCFSYDLRSPTDYGVFMAYMFAPVLGSFGTSDTTLTLGAIPVCLLLWGAIAGGLGLFRKRREAWTQSAVIATLTSYCLLFCASTAYGRICIAIWAGQVSRYAVYMVTGLLGVYFLLLTIRPPLRNALIVIYGASLALGSFAIVDGLREDMEQHKELKSGWKNCYLTFGDLNECNKYGKVYPWEPESTHLQEKLDFLKKNHQNLFADSR